MNVINMEQYRFLRQQPRRLRAVEWKEVPGPFAALRVAVPAAFLFWAFLIGLTWEFWRSVL